MQTLGKVKNHGQTSFRKKYSFGVENQSQHDCDISLNENNFGFRVQPIIS